MMNEIILKKIFEQKAYEIYVKMNNDDKQNAIEWFEIHGESTSEMLGAEVYEDWDDSQMFKFDLNKLKKDYPNIYNCVAKEITMKKYGMHSIELQDKIEQIFIEDPEVLTKNNL